MANLTRKATTLIRDMITADGRLPVYNVRPIYLIMQCSVRAISQMMLMHAVSCGRRMQLGKQSFRYTAIKKALHTSSGTEAAVKAKDYSL
jgi:hypothetical protein